MRKQTKLVAVLSAAALLAIGASMTSFAATKGWSQEGGEWVYLDSYGDRVSNKWVKSGDKYFYLGDDGLMLTDAVVTADNGDVYYVDASGARVENAWVAVDNDDITDEDISTVWYHFGSNGKAKRAGSDKEYQAYSIPYGDGQNAYFVFDGDGIMQSGWLDVPGSSDSTLYYLGDENQGWAHTGWQYIDIADVDMFSDVAGDEIFDSEEWFYFDSKGKATKDKKKYINGKWYVFNEKGIMLDKWVSATASFINDEDVSSSYASGSNYHEEDNGWRDKGWVKTYAKNGEFDDSYDSDTHWFWILTNGEAFRATDANSTGIKFKGFDGQATLLESDSKKLALKYINGKYYMFDGDGKMQKGLFKLSGVKKGQTTLDDGWYYFNEDGGSVEGQMVTKKKVTISKDGEDRTFYFDAKGRAYQNVMEKNGTLYNSDGQIVNGYGDGNKYEFVEAPCDFHNLDATNSLAVRGGTWVLINGQGKIRKNTGSGTVKDMDGNKYSVGDPYYTATPVND